jgi:hypothetical protein
MSQDQFILNVLFTFIYSPYSSSGLFSLISHLEYFISSFIQQYFNDLLWPNSYTRHEQLNVEATKSPKSFQYSVWKEKNNRVLFVCHLHTGEYAMQDIGEICNLILWSHWRLTEGNDFKLNADVWIDIILLMEHQGVSRTDCPVFSMKEWWHLY